MKTGYLIDYKTLRKVNPEAARLAVLEYLSSNGGNISQTAKTFGINRTVVYDILDKQQEEDLTDRSKAPHSSPQKTPVETEDKVVALKNKNHLGPKMMMSFTSPEFLRSTPNLSYEKKPFVTCITTIQ